MQLHKGLAGSCEWPTHALRASSAAIQAVQRGANATELTLRGAYTTRSQRCICFNNFAVQMPRNTARGVQGCSGVQVKSLDVATLHGPTGWTQGHARRTHRSCSSREPQELFNEFQDHCNCQVCTPTAVDYQGSEEQRRNPCQRPKLSEQEPGGACTCKLQFHVQRKYRITSMHQRC